VFITEFHLPMGPRAIERAVAMHMSEAGIPGTSVHTLRRTFANHQVKQGTKLDAVRQALGHASLPTTSIYISLAREEMDQELQASAL
jgi:site-specific recombinase XerD